MESSGFSYASSCLNNLPSTDKRGLHSTSPGGHQDTPVTWNQAVMREGGGESNVLLCPFYAHDWNTWRRCREGVHRNVADIRNHIRRAHMQQLCQSCRASNGECLDPKSCKLGVAEEQFEEMKPLSRKSEKIQEWTRIYKIIFPNDAVPASIFASGETAFVKRLLDIINSEQWQNLASALTWTNPGPFGELPVIDQLIEMVRYWESLPDGFVPSSGSSHTKPQIFDSVKPVSGEGSHALPSGSSQPADPQLGGRSTPLSSAGAASQKQSPNPGPWSEFEGFALKKEGPYNQASTQPTGSQTHPQSCSPGGQFQYQRGNSPEFDANQLPLPFGLPGEQLPPLSGGSNQITTNQHPYVYDDSGEVYLVDPWNPENPL